MCKKVCMSSQNTENCSNVCLAFLDNDSKNGRKMCIVKEMGKNVLSDSWHPRCRLRADKTKKVKLLLNC